MSDKYFFGAGGFKLGERVEVLTTEQRGILICEVVHISGCNTYGVFLPNVKSEYSNKPAVKHYDYLILRKLEPNEAVYTDKDNLTDETIYAPKGLDVNATWLKESSEAGKEPIPEIDEAVGVEDISLMPGAEVWHKFYNRQMLVSFIYRDIYEKELNYGLTYMDKGKEVSVVAREYALIPMRTRIKIYSDIDVKTGALFTDSPFELKHEIHLGGFEWFAGEV